MSALPYVYRDFEWKPVPIKPTPVESRDALIERLVKALEAAQELAKVAEGLTSCRSDDEFVWGVQEKINTALAAAKEQQP